MTESERLKIIIQSIAETCKSLQHMILHKSSRGEPITQSRVWNWRLGGNIGYLAALHFVSLEVTEQKISNQKIVT